MRLTALCLVLSGCAAVGQWPHRPVPVRLAADLSEACTAATQEALAFWNAHGVDYLSPTAEPGAYGVLVVERDLPKNELGRATSVPGVVLVTLEACTLQNAAHELGHALGLGHHPDPWNLMHPTTVGGVNLRVTPEQLESVR
jgi:hypothetical protein